MERRGIEWIARLIEGDSRDRGEERELFEFRGRTLGLGFVKKIIVLCVGLAETVSALFGYARREQTQPRVIWDEHVGALLSRAFGRSNQAPDGLTKEEISDCVGGVHADLEARNVDAFGHHSHSHNPGIVTHREVGDLTRGIRIVRGRHYGRYPYSLPQDLRNPLRVVLIHGNDHTRGAGVGLAQVHHLPVRLHQYRLEPFAFNVKRCSKSLARQCPSDLVIETRRMGRTIRGRPFHATVDSGKIDGAHNLAVA